MSKMEIDSNGYYTEGRYRHSLYKMLFVAKIDIPYSEVKAGDKVAVIAQSCRGTIEYSIILKKPYKDKETGYYIDRIHNIDPKDFCLENAIRA